MATLQKLKEAALHEGLCYLSSGDRIVLVCPGRQQARNDLRPRLSLEPHKSHQYKRPNLSSLPVTLLVSPSSICELLGSAQCV